MVCSRPFQKVGGVGEHIGWQEGSTAKSVATGFIGKKRGEDFDQACHFANSLFRAGGVRDGVRIKTLAQPLYPRADPEARRCEIERPIPLAVA